MRGPVAQSAKTPPTVVLLGNPNVGKSTLFNTLTGHHQHTGNWSGKTVGTAIGRFRRKEGTYRLLDTPGTYALTPGTPEEVYTIEALTHPDTQGVLVVADALCLRRSLPLILSATALCDRVLLCINLIPEAEQRGVHVDLKALEAALGIPVLPIDAKDRRTARAAVGAALDALLAAPGRRAGEAWAEAHRAKADGMGLTGEAREAFLQLALAKQAEQVYAAAVTVTPTGRVCRDERIDKILTHRLLAYPILFVFLAGLFWITLVGANGISEHLCAWLFSLEAPLSTLLHCISLPPTAVQMLVEGMYRVVAFVVGVMLPPMAIFFPLFSLLEDMGVLPRLAYNVDRPFACAGCQGKGALCMCMSFGCNAVGVSGARIIGGRRERLISMMCAGFIPCNGRFPTLTVLLCVLLYGSGRWATLYAALLLAGLILLCVLLSLLSGRLLSRLLPGEADPFAMELPPYRMPSIGRVLLRSLLDRTLHVLGRAVAVAAPMGLLIFLLARPTEAFGTPLSHITRCLDPLGRFFGMDGVILAAFLLGLPAKEIVLPLILMMYEGGGVLAPIGSSLAVGAALEAAGWTQRTLLCTLIFFLLHYPCATTLLTIKREAGGWRYAWAAALLPTVFGLLFCLLLRAVL